MGVTLWAMLYCDGDNWDCECDERIGETQTKCEALRGELSFQTKNQYREYAKMNGWVFRKGNKAYCPKCWQAMIANGKNY